MFGRIGFLFFITVTVSACAQPKYVNQPEGQNGSHSQSESSADCSIKFQTSGNCLTWKWEKYPTETDMGSLVFKVYRLNSFDSTPIEIDPPSTPAVVLWMPSMGHGSSPTTVSRLDVGTFRAANVYFVMPGEWQIKFQVKEGNTIDDEAVVSFTF